MSKTYSPADLHEHAELTDLLPPLPADEYEALKQDIAASTIYTPLLLSRSTDGRIVVLDGHNRLMIARELNLPFVPGTLLDGLSDEEQVERGVKANTHRRNLSREERRVLVSKLLKRNPARANNWIARVIGCSDMTVASVRGELEATSQIGKLDTRIGADGKERPAHQPKPARSGKRKDHQPSKAKQQRAMREAQAQSTATYPDPEPEEESSDPTPAPTSKAEATEPETPDVVTHEPATAEGVRRHHRRPLDARIRDLIAAAQAMALVDDDELDALHTNDLMIAGLRNAVGQVNRVIVHHTSKGGHHADGRKVHA